jgi:hypothetical protein
MVFKGCYQMGKKSLAQIRRELRGIKQEIDPIKAAAGRKGAIVTNAKRAGISIEQATKSAHFKQLAKSSNQSQAMGGEHAEGLIANEALRAAKLAKNQEVKLENISYLFGDNCHDVSKKLVNMALGEDEFDSAPASVQRLAMLDVLTYAGINQQAAESQNKNVHEMNRQELESLIAETKLVIEKN